MCTTLIFCHIQTHTYHGKNTFTQNDHKLLLSDFKIKASTKVKEKNMGHFKGHYIFYLNIVKKKVTRI